jgi:hypothetical protein
MEPGTKVSYQRSADIPDPTTARWPEVGVPSLGKARPARPEAAGDSGKGAARGVAPKTFPKTGATLAALAAVS